MEISIFIFFWGGGGNWKISINFKKKLLLFWKPSLTISCLYKCKVYQLKQFIFYFACLYLCIFQCYSRLNYQSFLSTQFIHIRAAGKFTMQPEERKRKTMNMNIYLGVTAVLTLSAISMDSRSDLPKVR